MNRHLRLALGTIGFAAGCVMAAVPTLADDHPRGPGGSSPHVSGAPSPGTSGGPHFQYNGNAPHFAPGGGFPQHQQFYRPQPGGGTWQGQHGVQPYRGTGWPQGQRFSTPSHGYAPGAWAHGSSVSRSSTLHASAFRSYRGRNISALGGHDREVWRGGNWRHTWHNGHYGWWWFTGGGWFFYDAPIYPYPDYISDYEYDDYGDADYGPGDVWYYCPAPPGYYPYVSYCMYPWQPVPAQ
jgi:hypothetical protein